MNRCIESGSYLTQRLDEAVEALAPAVAALLQRISPAESVATDSDETGYRCSVPLRFADGIGRAAVVIRLFRYREQVRIDVEIAHNRMLARADGSPSDRRCYLNDFVASVSLQPETEQLPVEFVQSVLRGVLRARDAVQRHNREQQAPWNQVRVAALEEHA